jgi:hypothetical protein
MNADGMLWELLQELSEQSRSAFKTDGQLAAAECAEMVY